MLLDALYKMFGYNLDEIRSCRYGCVNMKRSKEKTSNENSEQNNLETADGYCGSGFIIHKNSFELLRQKLRNTLKQFLEKVDSKFYTDFSYLIITNHHVITVRVCFTLTADVNILNIYKLLNKILKRILGNCWNKPLNELSVEWQRKVHSISRGEI